MEVRASLNRYRHSPRKVRVVANLVKGKSALHAIVLLGATTKRASNPLAKLLQSALANAKQNNKLAPEMMYVKSLTVNEGPTMKRSMPRAFGRASRINKRTSRVDLILASRESAK